MKLKETKVKIIIICFCLLCYFVLFSPTLHASPTSEGYSIDSYDIKMIVNENNTFDITEIITVNFTGPNKHGIFRKIPLRNTVTRLDGTQSNNRTQITNIKVSDPYSTSIENGYKVLKIGDKHSTVYGLKTYTIQYTYNIGKDPLKDADELYFNLIGTEWDTSISHTKFTIAMPKEFDSTRLGFSSGYKYSQNSSNVSYSLMGNVIEGSLEESLYANQGLTVRLTLPEGYFVGAKNVIDLSAVIKLSLSLLCVLIAYLLWRNYGKDDPVIDTVEFYPPDGINSAELAYIYKGSVEKKDIVSLLIYLANKGYLKIEECENNNQDISFEKIPKGKDFKIIKLKDYDGEDQSERDFFNGLFRLKEEVTRKDLYNRFFSTIDKIESDFNHGKRKGQKEIYEPASLSMRTIIIVMMFVTFILTAGFSIFKIFLIDIRLDAFFLFIITATFIPFYHKPNIKLGIICAIILIGTAFLSCLENMLFDNFYIFQFIVQSLCIIALVLFLGIMQRRNEYGSKMLGRILGFKKFLEYSEKPRLEQLVLEDPQYFYHILPYTYVLGISNKWIEKFEDIALQEPEWYGNYTHFDYYTFHHFMDSTYSSISHSMISVPQSSSNIGSSGGGFSGGGFSGGGSGGGGGSSW